MAPRQPNNLTNSEREGIKNFLLQRFDDDNKHNKLKKGAVSEAAALYGVSRSCIGATTTTLWGT